MNNGEISGMETIDLDDESDEAKGLVEDQGSEGPADQDTPPDRPL